MREMGRIKVGMQGMGQECWCRESAWGTENLIGNTKNVGNQGSDEGNQGGNLKVTSTTK